MVAEDVLTKLRRARLGPTSTKVRTPAAYIVCKPLHPLNGRGDLVAPACPLMARHPMGEFAGLRWQPTATGAGVMCIRSHGAQWLAGRGDDAGVEGVADRQLHGLVAAPGNSLMAALDGLAGAADDRLGGAVDVGRNDIAVDFGQSRLTTS